MIYAQAGEQPTRNVPTSKAERAAFVLSDAEILQLARLGCVIEDHYGCPMDIEWAKDGEKRRDLHRPGAARDGAVARGGRVFNASYTHQVEGQKLVSRPERRRRCGRRAASA